MSTADIAGKSRWAKLVTDWVGGAKLFHRSERLGNHSWHLAIYLVAGLSNAAILVAQQLAIRLLAPVIGSSIETWSAIIAVFLVGIAIGNFVAGWITDRVNPLVLILSSLTLGGLSVYGMSLIAHWLNSSSALVGYPLAAQIMMATLAVCLVPSILLSLSTAPSIRSLANENGSAGRVAGTVFAAGTLGSLIGNYVTGFVLLAYFGVESIVLVTTFALLAVLPMVAFGAWMRRDGVGLVPAKVVRPTVANDSQPQASAKSFSLWNSQFIAAVFIVTLCSLAMGALEGVAFRVLAPIVGVSVYLGAGVVGVVLTGMAVGNKLGGRLAGRGDVVKTLATCLSLASLATLFVPVVWNRLMPSEQFIGLGLPLQVIACSFVLFFLPSILFGTITPQVIGVMTQRGGSTGAVSGLLYGFSTLGCVVGILAASWLLVSQLGAIPSAVICGFVPLVPLLLVNLLGETSVRRSTRRRGLGLVLFGTCLLLTYQSPYTAETKYFAITVFEDKIQDRTVKCLMLDHLIHSSVDVNDPNYLFYRHEEVQGALVRSAAHSAREQSRVPRVLIIGGGGYTLPRWIEAQPDLQDVIIDVVEIDPAVTETCYEHLGLSRQTRINSFAMDGRQFVKNGAEGSYDLIIQDAVNDLSVPFHLMTVEYNQSVRRLLHENSLYLLTVIDNADTGRILGSSAKTMQRCFGDLELLLPAKPAPDTRNVWIVASRKGVTDTAVTPILTPIDEQYMSEDVYVMPREQVQSLLTRPDRISPPLTDDYAPVDTLMSGQFRDR